jgi:hypothetical protein
MFYHPDEDTHLATVPEAISEWAINCNASSDRAWILSDYDVWVRNPRYTGPAVRHPEDDSEYDYGDNEGHDYVVTGCSKEENEDNPF